MAPSSAPPKARLLCRTSGQTYDIESASTVGKSMDNQIVLQSPTISRLHARVFPKDGCFWLEDMGSKNGTRLDGTPVDEAMPLERLHVITFADGIDFVFVMAADAAQSETTLPHEPLAQAAEPSEPRSEEPAAGLTVLDMSPLEALPELDETTEEASEEPAADLTVMDMSPLGALPELDETTEEASEEPAADLTVMDMSPLGALPELHEDPGQASPSFVLTTNLGERGLVSFAISEGQTVLGRAPDCGISIPDEKFLSRRHAIIEVRGSEVLLRHLGSLNGTWIDGDQIDEATLRPGDSFKLGPDIEFTLVAS
jgi:pSer/pThr/pTyr-binding forkhead associated (FHA) protein